MRRRVVGSLVVPAVALFLALPALAGGQKAASGEKDHFNKLTVDEVQKKIADPNVHVYDGNGGDVYKKGHVPGAVLLSSNDIKDGVLPADKETPLIFYCANEMCMECHQAAQKAMALGYHNVSIMPAGIEGWVKASKPVVTGENPS